MNNYRRSHTSGEIILNVFLYLGYAGVALGVLLVILGFINPGVELRYGQSRPFGVLLFDILPGVGVIASGLWTVILVQVAGAILDTAETTWKILGIQEKLLAQTVSASGAVAQSSTPAIATAPEVYGRKMITQSGNSFYVDGIKFADNSSARAYIDNSVRLPPSPRQPS
jgi:hypothetical protein